jgi:hypothetical protein
MNFNLTKGKITIAFTIGFLTGFYEALKSFPNSLNFQTWAIYWLGTTIIVYIILSILQIKK